MNAAASRLATWAAAGTITIAAAAAICANAAADVARVEIERRQPILPGVEFGSAGAYEELAGAIHFEFDPDHAANERIVDLHLAPRNDRGLVEARANFIVLQPIDPAKRSGVALVEVSNRGGRAALSHFNRATRSPNPALAYGDGFLFRLGLTIIWVGWQHDVPAPLAGGANGLLRLEAPVARHPDGSAIEGLVRADWVIDRATQTLEIGHRGHIPYPPVDPLDPRNVLTVRDGRDSPRTIVPTSSWMFGRFADGDVVAGVESIAMPAGFMPGRVYELVYSARDPKVAGLGLAAIRDVIAYAKHDDSCPFPAELGVAFGVSQSGRFLRHFLYQGFNTDEEGRIAFDGMLIHAAGAGRGSFNHRFAQPSRDAHRFSSFFYPTDLFPFAGQTLLDPETGESDGLFAHMFHSEHVPKVMYTNTGYEYWGRAASLVHTTPSGLADVELLPNERAYLLSSAQHFVGPWPPRPSRPAMDESIPRIRGNPVDALRPLRSLLVHMLRWVRMGEEPPASMTPSIADRTLVRVDELNFPLIPGVETPAAAHEAVRLDFGPRFADEGIIDFEPPVIGAPFPALVPQVDVFGNEVGGVPTVETLAPLATYAPWHLRGPEREPAGELADFEGTYIPLSLTEADRVRLGDPRPSIESMYPTREAYIEAARRAAERLAGQRLLTAEDAQAAFDRAMQHWDWLVGRDSVIE